MTDDDVLIRPYQSGDRAAIRHICCETADRGEPVENFFSDRELMADLVTRYYTDFEPQSAWVAEVSGRVMGYLTGALDTSRSRRIVARRIVPAAVGRAILRGALFGEEAWAMLRALWRSRRGYAVHRHHHALEDYPAHLHIDLLKDLRGRQAGRRLMTAFFDQVRRARVPGIHATVRGDNAAARLFFERMGFNALYEYSMFLPMKGALYHAPVVVYGKKI